MKYANKPRRIHSAFALTKNVVLLAPDGELVAAGLLPVFEATPLPDCDGIVDGVELPTLAVALPSARSTT